MMDWSQIIKMDISSQQNAADNNKQNDLINIVQEQKKLLCIQNNDGVFLCATSGCLQPAVVCRNPQCSCLNSHNHDSPIFLKIKGIQTFLKTKKKPIPQDTLRGIDKILQIYSIICQQISIDREQLQFIKQNYGMHAPQAQVLNCINYANSYGLSGDLLYKMNLVKTKIKVDNGFSKKWVDQFWSTGYPHLATFMKSLSAIAQSSTFLQAQVFKIKNLSWNHKQNHSNMKIIGDIAFNNDLKKRVALINAFLRIDQKKCCYWRIKIQNKKNNLQYQKNLSSFNNVMLGVCKADEIIQNNYQINEQKQGAFLLSNNKKYCYNKWGVNSNFSIQQGNSILIQYDPQKKRLTFFKDKSNDVQVINDLKFTDQSLCPCVCLPPGFQAQIVRQSC